MKLFDRWLNQTKELQKNVYFINYEEMDGDDPRRLRNLIEYMRWNMLAIDDELAEMRQAI